MEAGTSSDVENTMQEIFGVDEEDPYQDSGSEYLPTRSPSPTALDLLDILADNHSQNDTHLLGASKRSRATEAKKASSTAKCGLKCYDKVGAAQQKQFFDRFYAMESFSLQSYLFSLVKVLPKKRCSFLTDRRQTESRRSNTRVYTVPNSHGLSTTVCKEFFKKVFAVSDGRITRVLKTKLSIPTPPIDKRGKHVPVNKTTEEKVQNVKTFIDKFPKYESHYTLHKSMNRRFLAPDLSLPKMYSMYCDDTSDLGGFSNVSDIWNVRMDISYE
ncbi:unnamed protein product [Euphydryas editha]|uniref:PiggyBac transposable element-derived protein domain-containing protein n=1 Tax=Euphydryas editha TaxID=104508 RepID=A0AAU9TPA9_EUPED|nr:unnamed protein product [Euphydryas editha]